MLKVFILIIIYIVVDSRRNNVIENYTNRLQDTFMKLDTTYDTQVYAIAHYVKNAFTTATRCPKSISPIMSI